MSLVADQVALGWRMQQAGQFAAAEAAYRAALQADPTLADVWSSLGSVCQSQGKLAEALACYDAALRLRPAEARYHNNRANVLTQFGRPTDAIASYREAIRLRPDYALAYANLGNALAEQGQLDEAVATLHEAVRLRPDLPSAHNNLGFALLQQKRAAEAVGPLREAVRLDPRYADAFVNLGLVCQELGRLDEALGHFRQAVLVQPGSARAHNSLGCLLSHLGRCDEAAAALQEALRLRPQYAEAVNNLGTVLSKLGRLADATECFRQALAWKPGYAAAHLNLGVVLWDRTRLDEAEEQFRQALAHQPDLTAAHGRLGHALADRGLMEEAERHYREAQRLGPGPLRRYAAETLLPPIYRSVEEVAEVRARLADNLARLEADGVRLDLTREPAPTLFYLAYQGLNDRPLLERAARLLMAPHYDPGPRPRRDRLHVAFVSRYLRRHTVGELLKGWIAGLPREEFDVAVYAVGRADDPVTRFLRERVAYHDLPFDLPAAREALRQAQPDVLFYTDTGMDPLTTALAASRLAPVQCVTWGHPSTSGLPTVDYFVSSDLFEPPDGDEHYTEKLVRLPSLPFVFTPPAPARSHKTRADLGLPEGVPLYASPQSLFKFHPEFDALLRGILDADPHGYVLLNQAHHPYYRSWEEMLRQRFTRTMPHVADRIVFLPRLEHDDYLRLHDLVDVLLDPPSFNGGHTSLQGLACGVPIVTLAGRLLKARMTAAFYRRMGLEDLVATTPDEYVQRAVLLATDRDHAADVRRRIRERREALIEDRQAVRDLAAFLRDVGTHP